jgi:V/A-type H+-transporting ATPase subunit F
MKEILLLTPEDARDGFSLTGVHHQVTTPEEAWATLQESCHDPALGVIAIDARLLEQIEPDRLRQLTEQWPGVLVTLPAPADEEKPPLDELQQLVRRALGYHVRLET